TFLLPPQAVQAPCSEADLPGCHGRIIRANESDHMHQIPALSENIACHAEHVTEFSFRIAQTRYQTDPNLFSYVKQPALGPFLPVRCASLSGERMRRAVMKTTIPPSRRPVYTSAFRTSLDTVAIFSWTV
ncbi:unnamed protein product, partial [Mycena citricolor]